MRLHNDTCTAPGEKKKTTLFSGSAPHFVRGKPLPDYGPFSVYRRFRRIIIEQTSLCPNKCMFCPYLSVKNRHKGTIPLPDLKYLLHTLPHHSGIVEVAGSGEPFVLDDLPERIRLIRQIWPDAYIMVLSSLSVPRDDSYFTRLIHAGASRVDISCYGHTAEDYYKLHGRDAFDVVCRNIKVLGEFSRRFGTDVSVHTFSSTDAVFDIKDPEQKLAEFATFLRKHNITHHFPKEIHSGAGRVSLANVHTDRPPWPCSTVWGFRAGDLMIGWDLEVWPCCFMPEKKDSFGNLREICLEEIFISSRYREFYESQWGCDFSKLPVCAQCTHPTHLPSREELVRLATYEGNRLAGREVYFWGCGEAYRMHKIFFTQTRPRCILYDTPGEKPDEVDGISVRHPDDVLLSGEKLPIIVFAAPKHNQTILETLSRRYPQYGPDDIILCLASMG